MIRPGGCASKDATKKNHLDTRAWCFQEEQLSLRMLRYHENGLHWSCISLNSSEASVTSMRRQANDILSGIGYKLGTTVDRKLDPTEDKDYGLWERERRELICIDQRRATDNRNLRGR